MKSSKVSVYYSVGTKHCNFNTIIDSSPSATPQKFLWWIAMVLSLKVWKQIFENVTMASKKEINVFHRNSKEFNVLLELLSAFLTGDGDFGVPQTHLMQK